MTDRPAPFTVFTYGKTLATVDTLEQAHALAAKWLANGSGDVHIFDADDRLAGSHEEFGPAERAS